jgi:outer membrane protein OmpA-like peptidoglycan-associated protein
MVNNFMMKLHIKTFLIMIFISFLLGSCVQQETTKKAVYCPEPEIFCTPEKWDGLAYDSSFGVNQVMDYYYVFEKVNQINTMENEWALSFIDKRRAALMYDDAGKQKVMIIRMIRYNKGSHESGMGIPVSGHTGAMSVKENEIILSVSPTGDMIGRADLYAGNLSGNYVGNIHNLGEKIHQNDFTWESHPALSADGQVLFFSSDRIVGYGGTDIWFSIKLDDGSWSEPFNCGKMINTGCSEITPFINNDNKKIIFSSAGHETVGGYDIFESQISDEFWKYVETKNFTRLSEADNFFSSPKNLRPPLNTKADELFPSSPCSVDSLLYYSSNQDADKASLVSMEGGFDIFVRKKIVNIKEETKDKVIAGELTGDIIPEINLEEPEIDIVRTFTLEGTVYNAVTLEELPDADVVVRKKPENELFKEVKTDSRGVFSIELDKDVEYEVTAQAENLFFESKPVFVEGIDDIKVMKMDFNVPEMLTLRINFPTDVYDAPYRFTLDSNGIETSQEWQTQIELLAENIKNSKVNLNKVVLVGHTDDVGSVAYNKNLGKNRVEFVINELIKRGVPSELLEGRSAGETSPLLRKENESLELYRKRLRRVELSKVWNK